MTPGQSERSSDELGRARAALRSAAFLLEREELDDATSRLYYAVFHAARAALTAQGRWAKTHSGQITLFITTFGPAPVLGTLFDLRGRADYGPGIDTSGDALLRLVAEAEGFIVRCEQLVAEEEANGKMEPDPPPDL